MPDDAAPTRAAGPGRPPPDRILLIGLMGAGKTTVGTALAALLGWRYLDNDALLALAEGTPTPDLLATAGTAALRRAESSALSAALELPGPLVAGVAAGVVTSAEDRARLAAAYTVWLQVDLDELVERVRGTARPWLGEDPRAAMAALAAGRDPLYRQVASLVVTSGAGSDPRALARRIAEAAGLAPSAGQERSRR